MITIGDYIKSKFARFRVNLENEELGVLLINNSLNADSPYTKELFLQVEIAIVNVIPDLLLMPDKQTGDTSLKWDRSAIAKYYSIKCKEFDLPDLLADPIEPNEIHDISNIW